MAEIHHLIEIGAPPSRVYPLVGGGPGFAEWWAADVEQSTDAIVLGFFNRTTVYRLRGETMILGARAAWAVESGEEWSGTHLIFILQPKGGGTLLRFLHSEWRADTDFFHSCNTVWGELMFRLKGAAEGKKPGPLFTRNGMVR